MAREKRKSFTPVYVAEASEPGLYLNLDDAEHPRLAPFAEASHYQTRIDVCTAALAARAPLPAYDVVRVDRP